MKIVTVGDNCIDYYQNLETGFPGGNPVNVSVYLKRLGVPTAYVGVVGNDKYGEIMIKALKEKGVDTSHLHVVEGNTAVTQVDLIDGERVFGDYDEGVLQDFKLTSEDIDFLCGFDLIISGLWGKIEKDLANLKDRGRLIAFDFATKLYDPVVDIAIDYVDYAFFAADEDNDELRSFIIKQQKRGPEVVVVTLGENGSVAFDGIHFYKFGIITCNVVDSMGAGDSYIAGFLKARLEGNEITECMMQGAMSSSITLGYTGAW